MRWCNGRKSELVVPRFGFDGEGNFDGVEGEWGGLGVADVAGGEHAVALLVELGEEGGGVGAAERGGVDG